MKTFVGTDIVEIEDFEQAVTTWKEKFLNRIYTELELDTCQRKIPGLAARFAVKESVLKALEGYIERFSWKDIQILSKTNGCPYVQMSGTVLQRAKELGISSFSISLSHSKKYAIAVVISYVE